MRVVSATKIDTHRSGCRRKLSLARHVYENPAPSSSGGSRRCVFTRKGSDLASSSPLMPFASASSSNPARPPYLLCLTRKPLRNNRCLKTRLFQYHARFQEMSDSIQHHAFPVIVSGQSAAPIFSFNSNPVWNGMALAQRLDLRDIQVVEIIQ
jgi:hypothetical protein